MMKVRLPDGSERSFEGENALALAKSISQKLGKEALAAEMDGKLVSLSTPLKEGALVKILTFTDEAGRSALRHTASHIMAQAVLRVFKDKSVKLGIGHTTACGVQQGKHRKAIFSSQRGGAFDEYRVCGFL